MTMMLPRQRREEEVRLLIGGNRREESNNVHSKSNTDGENKQSKKMKS